MGKDCRHISKVVRALRRVNDELTVRQLAILLWLNEHPESGVTTIAEQLDLAKGTVSRNLKTLGTYYEKIKGEYIQKGMDLIKTERDPYSERNKFVSLTDEGEKLITIIWEADEGVSSKAGSLVSSEDLKKETEEEKSAKRSA